MWLVGLDFLVSQATVKFAMQISKISHKITYQKLNKVEFILPQ